MDLEKLERQIQLLPEFELLRWTTTLVPQAEAHIAVINGHRYG
jgi:hypothetical protein